MLPDPTDPADDKRESADFRRHPQAPVVESGRAGASARPADTFPMRWWIYQKERFPVFAHGPLILAFSACAVSYSALLTGGGVPRWPAYAAAFLTCLLFFLQLRIADEFKDAAEDARWRPYRPVPRGLVKLAELRVVFVVAAAVQLAVALWWDWRLVWVLAVGWSYLALMSVEFFARAWLKARPVVYLLTHMGIMPLVDLFATACDWMPARGAMPPGLGPFLAASFCNGIVIEIGRKLRQPADEEEGVETYSRLWGRRGGATVWLLCMAATAGCALLAARRIGFAGPLAAVLGVTGAVALAAAVAFARGRLHGKRIEALAGVWTLALYLTLGVVPLGLRTGHDRTLADTHQSARARHDERAAGAFGLRRSFAACEAAASRRNVPPGSAWEDSRTKRQIIAAVQRRLRRGNQIYPPP